MIMQHKRGAFYWFSFIFLLDRMTKYIALHMGEPYVINRFLEFKLVFNRGISWGMFAFDEQTKFNLLTLSIIIIICILAKYTYSQAIAGQKIYAAASVLAGACSNVIDRIVYHGVIDFIHIHVNSWSWPIFNIADIAIVLGICWMVKEQYKKL